MSTHKSFDKICVVVILLAIVLTVLFMNGEAFGIQLVVDEDSQTHSDSEYFTANDQTADWDITTATVIKLNGDSISISDSSSAYVYDGNLVISGSGKYVISGTLNDGYISVDAYKNSKVWLMFSDVEINCSDNACLRVDQADKVFLTLADGTVNTLTSGDTLSAEALADGTYGAIFAHDDLTINGSGTLNITAGYKHGIKANDDLVITGGTISITAPGDGIHVNDSFRLKDADLTISTGDDGILVESEESYYYMESGSVTVTASGDALHGNGDILLAGGTVTIDAGDDGIHAAGTADISGGIVLINRCYEGIEAVIITMSAGDVTVYPSDDGFNANGGNGEETYISISGGTITIINENGRDADGLDSNGNIDISGGDIRISLTGSGSNCAIDCASESGGVCTISGGTVIACGSSSMAEGFDDTSEQCSLLYSFSGAETGTQLTLSDTEGNVLLSWEVPCSFSSANLSCLGMQLDGTYTLTIGDDSEEITLTETSASFGDAQSSMFGGNMNWGGMKQGSGAGMQGRTEDASGEAGTQAGQPDDASGEAGTEESAPESRGQREGMRPGNRPDGENGRHGRGDFNGSQASGEAGNFPEMDGSMPEMDGTMPDGGNGHQNQQGGQTAEETEVSETDTVEREVIYTSSTYILTGVCVLILAAGLVIAKLYKKH